jgi:UDP-2,3-diacylglucosamine hydrolase
MSNNSNPTALFVGDTHFHLQPQPAESKRLQRFLTFLDLSRQADHLILLGDIFDFWFDYPHFRLKGYEELLNRLDEVRSAGTKIHFVGGNHDIWAADYLGERFAASGQGGPITLDLGDRRVLLMHGDGILCRDRLYRSFRWLVRRKPAIAFSKALHPELLYMLARWLSGASRKATRDEAETIVERARLWLASRQNPDWDLLAIGHVHHPFLIEHEGRTMAAVGGWLGREGYGLWQDGHFELRDFTTDPPPEFTDRLGR